MTRLSLGDLVDLEARLLEEQGESEEIRRSRYRQLGLRLAEKQPLPEDPGALLRGLLRLDPRPTPPGPRFESGLRLLHSAIAILGLLLGGALSLALMHDSGRHPVNVLTVLAALVGTQLLLLLLLIVALIPRRDARASGPVQHLLRSGLTWILTRAGAAERMTAIQDRLDAHRGLLRWTLVRAAQVFGIAFNVAALAGCLYRIAVTDIAFGWSTTLNLDANAVHRLADALSGPWSWLTSHGTPSLDLIRLTQYSHLEGKYIVHVSGDRSADFARLGGWWSFLVFAIAVYGFLPRLIAFAVAGFWVKSILAATPRSNEDYARLCDWMRQPIVTTRLEGPDPERLRPPAAGADPEAPLPPEGTACELLDGGSVEQLLRERYGWTFDPGSTSPLVAVVSAWEEPTKGQLRRFASVRNRDLIVVLHDPSGKDDARRANIRDRWKRDLPKALAGVRVRVETL